MKIIYEARGTKGKSTQYRRMLRIGEGFKARFIPLGMWTSKDPEHIEC